MPKKLTATVLDETDAKLYTLECSLRAAGFRVRRPDAIEIAIHVAAAHGDDCLATAENLGLPRREEAPLT